MKVEDSNKIRCGALVFFSKYSITYQQYLLLICPLTLLAYGNRYIVLSSVPFSPFCLLLEFFMLYGYFYCT